MKNQDKDKFSNVSISRNENLKKQQKTQDKSEQVYLNSKKHLKTLVENALDIIMVLNSDGRIRFLSKSAKKILGNEPEMVTGTNIIDYIDPKERKEFKKRLSALINDKKELDSSEFKIRHRNGKVRHIESISKKIIDADGEPCIVVNSRDITERAKFQKILEKSQEQLSVAQKIAQVGSWEWDLENNVVRWSKELRRIYGITSGRLISDFDGFIDYLHSGDREHFKSILEKAIENKDTFQVEYRIVRPDGEERKIHTKGEVIYNDSKEPRKIIATGQDVTDFKKAEHQLLEYSKQLKTYNAKQDMIIENERNQIARDIHDELGQMLTVLKMDIYLVKERINQEVGDAMADSFRDDMKNIFEKFDTLVKSVQKITTSLRPEVIDDLGLEEAIKWQCHDFEEQTGIECTFINETENLNDMIREYKKAIFRIFQQALKNVGEHARATKAEINLKLEEDFFLLKVWDNGTGIKEDKIMHPNSLGMLSMRERSHYLGGELTIDGKNQGTTVSLKIPVEEIIFKY